MRRSFKVIDFRQDTLNTINEAIEIIDEYATAGYDLTLRQLFYQFVSRGLRENTERSYKGLGKIVSNGRLAGLIDWKAITDRTRFLRKLAHWSSPAEIIRSCADQYRENKWNDQPCYVEVWIEKDALVGVIEPACEDLDVPCFSCRGYVSQSAMFEGAGRQRRGGRNVILHLGDHDPSGVDMTRDIQDRLDMFLGQRRVAVKRIALSMQQIQTINPPPNPTKATDSRSSEYVSMYGHQCWELDALDPATMCDLIKDEVCELRDPDLWEESLAREEEGRETLERVAGEIECQ